MKYPIPMSSLSEGQCGEVTNVALGGQMRSRLGDLGLMKGCRIKCLQKSAGGDIAAYLICGAVIAIRKCDALKVTCRAV